MINRSVKSRVVTDIVQKLESEGTFTELVYAILEEAEKYFGTSNAAVLQLSSDENSIGMIVSYNKEDDSGISLNNTEISDMSICGDELMYITYEEATPEQKERMYKIGIKTSVTCPIYINNIIAMYFAVLDTESIDFNEDDIQLIRDVCKIIQSIAQKKVTRNSLLASYEVLREILGNIGSGIVVCSRQDGSIFFENDIAKNTEEVRRTIREALQEYFEQYRTRNNQSMKKRVYKPVEHYDAESGLWFEIKFADMTWIDGSAVVVCTVMDVTQKKKNQQKIEYQAQNDFLTGLYNRMKCETDLRKIIRDTVANGEKGAVMFIDLDDFKHINDGLGHQYGDILLQQIAAGLQGVPGLRDHCYRMGGDEFVVIITPDQYSMVDKICKNIIAMFNKPWYLMETEYFCTMSMGIATFPDDSSDVHEIIKLADIAMYESKRSGKNRYGFYDSNKGNNTGKRLDIENNMRQAIASEIHEFVVFYQPVVDVVTKECTSCEALVRWDSKALGFMAPGEFIPLAEYLGLITSIGDYVLEEACNQCRIWNENGHPDFRINVNLSVVQLLQKNVVDNIKLIMDRTGVNPKNIVLEITESFAINDMDRVLKIIEGLRKLGPKIALDDFGTGYSSLNYIKQLPLDIIKVDKTFIDDVIDDEYAQAFVKLIVNLSKTIGTRIVVEGIEKKEQYELLKTLGVDYIQGYLFGKPVPPQQFEKDNFKGDYII